MKKVLELYKPIGKTPLQTIEEYKIKHPELTGIKLAYAGRLDPMAEGLLLVLVGDECKKRKEYEKLPKTYEFEVLFGISTDTFDVMGKIVKISKIIPQEDLLHGSGEYQKSKINELIKKYQGKMLQEYPPYSSPRVNGKPLFWWAREKRLDEIKIPKKEITIYELLALRSFNEGGRFMNEYQMSAEQLLKTVHERIEKVEGEFRQKEILEIWDKKLKDRDFRFSVFSFKITCSSGTYVRSIANKMGEDLKVGAIAFSIKRTKIGKFLILNPKS